MHRFGTLIVDQHILTRAFRGVLIAEIAIGLFQRRNTVRHDEDLFDVFVGQDQHGGLPGMVNCSLLVKLYVGKERRQRPPG